MADHYGKLGNTTLGTLATKAFFEAAETWLSDGYYLDQRVIARESAGQIYIWAASISLFPLPLPLPPPNDYATFLVTDSLLAEQIQRRVDRQDEALQILRDAVSGTVHLGDGRPVVFEKGPREPSSEDVRDQWNYQPHLSVGSFRYVNDMSVQELGRLDNQLRLASTPFDGLNDLASWFNLKPPIARSFAPYIDLRVGPPVDIWKIELANDKVKVELHGIPGFDTQRLRLALRVAPGVGLARAQVANHLRWVDAEGMLQGAAEIDVPNADAVLVILMIGPAIVRRQIVTDPTKARNQRLLAFRTFDTNLKQLRRAMLEDSDSKKFEAGVAALLFTRGFTAARPLETAAPDVVVTTPSGRFALIECTLKVSDVAAKMGKLVDRRAELEAALNKSGHVTPVIAMLVCRQPKANLDANIDTLAVSNKVLVVTQESIEWMLDNEAKFPLDPDAAYDEALQLLAAPKPNEGPSSVTK